MDLISEAYRESGSSSSEDSSFDEAAATEPRTEERAESDYFNLFGDVKADLEFEKNAQKEMEFIRSQRELEERMWELSAVPPGPCSSSDASLSDDSTFKDQEPSEKRPRVGRTQKLPNDLNESELRSSDAANSRKTNVKSNMLKVVRGGHTKAVTCVNWNCTHSSYLVSSSFDGNVKVWNGFTAKCLRTLRCSDVGLNACVWTNHGVHILTGGYEGLVKLIDSESGATITTAPHVHGVSSIALHPSEESLVLTGSRSAVCAWDLRLASTKPTRSFPIRSGQVLDVKFLNGSEFICSVDAVSRESADHCIMAWDFASGTVLSNQIFHERYTCPCLRVDPEGRYFLAQTHGNYIAVFSTKNPYRMNKARCFKGHKVCFYIFAMRGCGSRTLSGYGIQFDVSPDGRRAASGDAGGSLFVYDVRSTSMLKQVEVFSSPCISTAYHPSVANYVALGSWSGDIGFCK